MAGLEDELGYDELDDCCRQEIQDYNHKQRVTRELRRFDRIEERNRIRTNIVNSIRSTSCDSCCGGRGDGDYAMLAYTRSLQNSNDDSAWREDNNNNNNSSTNNNDDGDRDSMDDLLDDDFRTPYELERLQLASAQSLQQAHSQQAAKLYGLAVHCEESLHHLARSYVSKGYVSVLHVYDPSASFCAMLDLMLERMAIEYTGTLFRRVPLSAPFLQKYLSDWGCEDCAPALLFFESGSLYLRRGFRDLGYPDDFFEPDLRALLSNSRALLTDIPSAVLAAASAASTGRGAAAIDSDDEAAEVSTVGGSSSQLNSYCSSEGCSRNFPHEHVGGGAGASFVSGGSQAGAEALADNIFTKV